MAGIKADDILMVVFTFAAFVLVYLGGKKLIFQGRGRMLILFAVLFALGAVYFGGKDQLPESVQERISDVGTGVRQWAEEKILHRSADGTESGGNPLSQLFSGTESTDQLAESIRDGLGNLDAVKTFFGSESTGQDAAAGG